MHIPYRSFHQRHTIKNYVWGELKHYVRYNTEEKNFKRQSSHGANIFGQNGGYVRSDKTPATLSRHKGKSVPQPARAENTISLSLHRDVNNSEPQKKKKCLHRDVEALQHSH